MDKEPSGKQQPIIARRRSLCMTLHIGALAAVSLTKENPQAKKLEERHQEQLKDAATQFADNLKAGSANSYLPPSKTKSKTQDEPFYRTLKNRCKKQK